MKPKIDTRVQSSTAPMCNAFSRPNKTTFNSRAIDERAMLRYGDVVVSARTPPAMQMTDEWYQSAQNARKK